MPEPFQIPLESVRVARPCRAEWGSMEGDDTVRFCQSCHKNVYNLSAMTKAEAETFVATTEGKACIRFYRRADGSVLTSDCPIGMATAKPKREFLLVGVWALLLALTGVKVFRRSPDPQPPVQKISTSEWFESMRHRPVIGTIINRVSPNDNWVVGDMAVANVPPATPQTPWVTK